MSLSLQQLAKGLQSEFRGDANLLITGVASASGARVGDLCFVQRKRYLPDIVDSDCSAVIVTQELAAEVSGKGPLLAKNPGYSFVQAITALGLDVETTVSGIHPTAQVAPGARLADHVTITAMSLVTKDIHKAGVYFSGTPLLSNSLWHRANVRYKGLDNLALTVAKLDKTSK